MDILTLKQQHNITQIISRTVDLKKRGQTYSGLCPFHKDTDPSLKVYPDIQFFKCYGCGAKGDVIDWIQMTVGVDFQNACRLLGNLPQTEVLFKPAPKKTKKISLDTVKYWHDNLGKKRTYFHNRGFANNTIDRELFGWTGNRYVIPLWLGIPQESEAAAVKLRRDDELELNKLKNDNPDLDEEQLQRELRLIPRYVLKGSYEPILYNAHVVEGKAEIWIFFGEFDAALASQLGLPSCSPVHGASSWASNWGGTYLRGAQRINIFPDKGEEDQGYRVKAMLGGRAQVCKFPEGEWKDFTDFILAGNNIGRLNEKEM